MSYIDHHELPHSAVLSIYVEKDLIWVDPDYQRQGDVWPLEKKQLLIDSIINRYDIPKLYFHKLDREAAKKKRKQYAVIDGRQRLEAIFGFMDGEFPLANDFEYISDDSIEAGGLTYEDLAKKLPRIKQRFDAFTLPITVVETDDLELIEEMFSRLNEAVPLNAAEKRNAIGGEMAKAIVELSESSLFAKKVRFSNVRYRHREVAARLLFVESSVNSNRLVDTKKPFLDDMVKVYKTGKKREVSNLLGTVTIITEAMAKVFTSKDILLAAQAVIPVYYLLFREAQSQGNLELISRQKLVKFNEDRKGNRVLAELDITKANFELLEFDRMSQQGTNDASSIRERLRILSKFVGIKINSDF
ncbi:MAG: DUF262 domain-containing protein [Hydrogenophaga sp.]|uniref:DUF262 domain-containing protein n=1 Tax=Hydrogenophaga sp. TaxID=1904254 RepID=UPI0025C25520|nr:DUF262 domain-containing protein [Hydrogenophaga sp.]MBT9551308.1 DUF262 domain-containing protein [Hydrogenophaga sp.]